MLAVHIHAAKHLYTLIFKFLIVLMSQAWLFMPAIPALGKLRQDFEVSLGYKRNPLTKRN